MRKKIIITFLMIIMLTNISLAAYPAELEEAELKALQSETDSDTIELLDNSEDLSVISQEIIYNDICQAGDDINITGIVDGNIYIIAKTATIQDLTLYGSAYIIADKIDIIDSNISDSVFAIAKEIELSNSIINDVCTLSQNLSINENTYIWRNVKTLSNTVTISGEVGRDFTTVCNNLNIEETATIEGTLNYYSKNEASISENVQNIGEVNYTRIEESETHYVYNINLYKIISIIFSTLIISCIVVFLVKKFKNLKRTEKLSVQFLKTFGKGIAVFVFLPIISLLLMITSIGVFFGIVFLMVYITFLYIATSITCIEIAYQILLKSQKTNIKNGSIIGLSVIISLIVYFLEFLPIIGSILRIIVILVGLGILYNILFQKVGEIDEN